MKRYVKLLMKLILSILVILIGLIIWVIFTDPFNICRNDLYKRYTSPNNKLDAVVFQRNCGATAAFSTQISIIDANDDLGKSTGNVYVIKEGPNDVAPILSWENDGKLIIHRPLNGSEFKAKTTFGWINPIDIVYE
jgi:hypothetical protein